MAKLDLEGFLEELHGISEANSEEEYIDPRIYAFVKKIRTAQSITEFDFESFTLEDINAAEQLERELGDDIKLTMEITEKIKEVPRLRPKKQLVF